jgi:two-component system, chemotaxis family, chemotaxis protein CheY
MFTADSRFLIVDDSKVVRDLISAALSQLNYKTIDKAFNGRSGWEKIVASVDSGRPYDLVFCDINMPEMNGLELLEMVRANPKTNPVPILMVTTEGEKSTVIKAVMAGVSGYMVKPFGVEDVKKKMYEVYKRLNAAQASSGV